MPHQFQPNTTNPLPNNRGNNVRLHLTFRLRRIVRHILKTEKHCKDESNTVFIFNKSYPLFPRLACFLIFLICMGLFIYQSYNRVKYYFQYPVAVDVLMTKTDNRKFPEMTICYHETEDAVKYFQKHRRTDCNNQYTYTIMHHMTGQNANYVWQLINTTTAIHSAVHIANKVRYPLDMYETITPWGVCATFRSDPKTPQHDLDKGEYEIVLKKYYTICTEKPMIYVYLNDPPDFFLGRRWQHHPSAKKVQIGLFTTKIIFVNRTNNPCISGHKYEKCHEKCFADYIQKNCSCWYPYFPKEFVGPVCEAGLQTSIDNFNEPLKYLQGFTGEPCPCTRKCSHRVLVETFFHAANYTNQSIFVLKFDDDYETIIIERLSYQFIDLLCDIGGNSGLFIGLSLLSGFELISKLVSHTQKKQQRPSFALRDSLFRVVNQVYKTTPHPEVTQKRNNYHFAPICKVISYAACTALLICAIINRVSYYISNPVQSNLEVKNIDYLEKFPTITLCPGDRRVFKMQKEIKRLKNYTDHCDVKPWELLELPNVDAMFVWNNTNIRGKELRHFHPFRFLVMPEGTCLAFDVDKKKCCETVLAKFRYWFRSNLPAACGTSHQKLYIQHHTRIQNYFHYRYLPTNHQLTLMFIIKVIKSDKTLHACITEEEHDTCKYNCLQRKLFSRITCSLPYMPKSNLNMCKSPSSVKDSHLTYLDLFYSATSADDCNCLPKCQTTIYETRAYDIAEVHPIRRTSWFMYLAHTVIEVFEKQPSYPLVKLLCDIGGWLGATLGYCILSSTEMLLLLSKSKKKNSKNGHQITGKQ